MEKINSILNRALSPKQIITISSAIGIFLCASVFAFATIAPVSKNTTAVTPSVETANLSAANETGCSAGYAKSIEQFGITWYFQDCEQYGQFANGDYWIVGPATITKITPESVVDSVNRVRTTQKDASLNYIYIDWIKNGTMVNPKPSPDNWAQGQGFDNSITQYGWYSSTLNVAPKITGQNLVVPANTSVVSSISVSAVPPSNGNYQDRIHTLAVLTVLPTPASEGSFRPSISGTDKSIKWNKSQLNYNILRKLTPVDGTPALSTVESYFEKPWQTQWEGNQTQGVSPIGSMPNYGGSKSTGTNGQGDSVSDAILSLHLNYTDAQKEKLYIRLVQYGLDVYGTVREAESMNVYMRDVLKKYDGFYRGAGGLNTGRKAPVVFAGLALNDSNIKTWSNGQLHKVFHEDKQTFYVSQSDVTRARRLSDANGVGCMITRNADGSCSRPLEPFTTSMIGTPEWIVEPYDFSPEYAGSNWGATYRSINGATFVGNSLALMLTTDGESTWNWPAYFDYSDRYWAVEYGNTGGVWDPSKETDTSHGVKKFHWNMWKAYRSLAGTYVPPITPTTSTLTTSKTGSGTITGTNISCGTDCTETYTIANNTSVTLTATPQAGYTFQGWSGDCTGTGSCVLTMNANKTVTANFSNFISGSRIQVMQTKNVRSTPALGGTTNLLGTQSVGARGTILSGPVTADNIIWWNINYDSGVDGWTGQDYLEVVNDVIPTTYTLATSSTNGTIVASPAKASYTSGEVVTLTAIPNTNYTFSGWTGCTSSTNVCTVTMDANKSVSASFTVIPTSTYTLTTGATGTGLGTITKSPNQTSYTSGTSVTLTATPAPGSTFTGWSGACTGTGSCVVTMNANKSVSANFNTGSIVVTNPNIDGPLKKNTSNPRYFTDNSGKAIYLSGSQVWDALSGYRPKGSTTLFNVDEYLQSLVTSNHNMIRLWTGEAPTLAYWENDGPYETPLIPWVNNGTLENPNFDLNTFNQAYFDRLNTIVSKAQAKGIYVKVMLFDGWALKYGPGTKGWNYSPFHRDGNSNGINGDPNNDTYGFETHSLAIPAVTNIQKEYIKKTIDTLNQYDNVIYEISNEDNNGVDAYNWQVEMMNYVKSYQSTKAKQHLVGLSCIYNLSGGNENSKLFSSSADFVSPCGASNSGYNMTYTGLTALTNPSKVIFSDTDHIWGIGGNADWVWKAFTRGYNPLFMDPYKRNLGGDEPSYNRNTIIKAIGNTLTFANKSDLKSMTPSTTACNTGYCLTNTNNEYIVYNPSNSATTINSLASGTYEYEWINVGTGAITSKYTAGHTSGNFSPTTGRPAASHALFVKKVGTISEFTLATTATNGSITRSPNQTSYTSGTSVTLTATPNAGYQFSSWTGCTSSTNVCTVTVNSNTSVSANFTVIPTSTFILTTGATGTGLGTITKSPNKTSYTNGEVVTLTATPAPSSTFTGWSGACTGTGSCVVTMNANKSVSASFNFSTTPTDPIPVITSPTANQVFPSNTTSVTVTWNGDASNYLVRVDDLTDTSLNTDKYKHYITKDIYTAKSIPIPVKAGHAYDFWVHFGTLSNYSLPEVHVKFSVAAPVATYTLATTATNGSITRSPNQTSYTSGTSVTLTATPNAGYQFSSWTGCTSSTNVCTVTVNSNTSVSANFTLIPTGPVTPTITTPTANQVFPSNTTSVTVTWNGKAPFLYRVTNDTNTSLNTKKYKTYQMSDSYTSNSVVIPVQAGNTYSFWVHEGTMANYSPEARVSFSVVPAVTSNLIYGPSALASFDGANISEIAVDDSKITNALTVSAKVMRNSSTAVYTSLVEDEDYTGNKGYYLGDLYGGTAQDSPICFRINGKSGDTSIVCESSAALSTTAFTHYVGVFDGGAKTIKLYRDGVQVASKSTAFSSVSTDPGIEEIGRGLKGQIKEIQIFNKVLNGSLASLNASTVGTFANTSTIFSSDLELGMTHPDVRTLQIYLNSNGYIVNPVQQEAGSPGYESNYFGTQTQHALMRFQRDNSIPVTGYFGVSTKNVMGR